MRHWLTILIIFIHCHLHSFSQTRGLDSLHRVLKNAKEDTSKVNSLCILCLYTAQAGKFTEARNYADQALSLAKKLNSRLDVAIAYKSIADIYRFQNKLTEAFKYFDTSLAISNAVLNTEKNFSERSRAKRLNATIYNSRAIYNRARKNYADAIRDFRGSIALWDEMGDKRKMIAGYQTLAHIYAEQNDRSESLKHLYDALKLAESIGDKKEMAEMLREISVTYNLQENYTEALKNGYDALRIAMQNGDSSNIAWIYNMIGSAYTKINTREALKAFDQAFRILSVLFPQSRQDSMQQSGSYGGTGEALEIQADSALLLGYEKEANEKYRNALKSYQYALKIMEDLCHICSCDALANLGSVSMKLKRYKEARRYIASSLVIATENRQAMILVRAYNTLSKLDSAEGNFRSAFENYKQYILYRDSLSNDKMTRINTQTRIQYEFDKKEDSLKQQQVITQTKLDSQKKQKNYYLGGSVMLGLLSLFVFLNFRNQKKINRLAADAHAKEKAELELQSLRAQLNPHFMFNSLNAIQELILKEENEKSQSYLARFAKLLRMLLENADKPFIPLQRELDFLHLYLSLENLRIPDLQFSIDVNKAVDTERTMIPNMILQPYIENAIWHGLSHKENDKRLHIRINNEKGFIKYDIEDNGVGRKKSVELKSLYRREHKSKGMELLSKRFKLLAKEYGSEVETTITDIVSGNESGTIVTIKVPTSFKNNLNKLPWYEPSLLTTSHQR